MIAVRVIRRLYFLLRRLFLKIGMYLAVVASYLFVAQRSYVVENTPARRSLEGARRIAVFVHYDKRGDVAEYVLHHLAALRGAGFEIVFTTNSPRLLDGARQSIEPLCARILRRRNVGYDFGAYKDALATLGDPPVCDEILLVNDSVYGPMQDLTAVLARCNDKVAAVWSITDNWERHYHLQSYFLLFKKQAIASEAFRRFWRDLRYVQSRLWVISKYEIGLTRAMMKEGMRCIALFPYRQAANALSEAVLHKGLLARDTLTEVHKKYLGALFAAVERGAPLNSTHHLWDYLIGEMGCPFIKRDLLLHNKMEIPFVSQWENLIRRTTTYDPDLILRHLETIAKNRAV
jgi:lipopolysaccharide biosynthesis protein